MLVLIGQKRIEWDGRHNCSQPSLAKFVYGTTAWKLVLAGCMGVVGFRARDVDQITNKWDGLIKDYKKLKDYIEGTGSGHWWGMNREEKKQLSKTQKMSLEFSEAMYIEMEGFVGRRQIFGRVADVVDSDRVAPPVARQFGRSSPSTREASFVGVESFVASTTAASESPTTATPGHDTPGSTGRKKNRWVLTTLWTSSKISTINILLVLRLRILRNGRGGSICSQLTLQGRLDSPRKSRKRQTWSRSCTSWRWRELGISEI